MTEKIVVENVTFAKCPSSASECIERSRKLCTHLELGNILYFPTCPFSFPQEDREFLLGQKQKKGAHRKNISYRPKSNKLTNISDPNQYERFQEIMRNFSQRSSIFMRKLLVPYGGKWELDYASFRPFQEKKRNLRIRARNDLLHIDAFPTRPMFGKRILRFFININPEKSRKWITGENFASLVRKYGGTRNLPFPTPSEKPLFTSIVNLCKKSLQSLHFPIRKKSNYDYFMLQMHNFLKENTQFQEKGKKNYWEFPPGSCWAVFTDFVSHAALEGQYALEQTFLIAPHLLLVNENSPLQILEKISGYKMLEHY